MSVNQKEFTKAMKAAMLGPADKLIKINGHEFNVKPVKVQKDSDGIRVIGDDGHHISHCLALRPDDQVFYSCRVTNRGTVEDLKLNVRTSLDTLKKWAKTVQDVLKLVRTAREAANDAKADAAARVVWKPAKGTDQLLAGNEWPGAANFLIANIVIAKAAEHLPGAIVKFPGT
jgi:hypothetical protein